MNLQQAEKYLLDLELFGMRFGLDRMHKLMTALGMPQRRFATIHVVGTNGKSSTVRFIAGILERHGLRTGSYTSPHLASFTERVEIGEQPISGTDFAAAVTRAAHAAELVNRTQEEGDTVTQFEALTAAAYHELARREVEVAVIEAGLGGRYDATNVIPSKVQVLTGVGLEHTRWLGPTIKDIAEEKLDVVRDHGILVTGELDAEAEAVAERVATERHATRVRATSTDDYTLAAHGAFQRANFALARAAAKAFLGELDERAVRAAAAEVRVPGRMQVISHEPLTVLDGAHNPAGAEAVAQALPELVGEREVVGVLGVLVDKVAAGMLRALLPRLDRVVFTHSSNPRSLSPGTLESLSEQLGGPSSETVADPRKALARARELAGSRGAVLVTGSIYLIADLVRAEGAVRASTL
jgi:dihydrofolate synthase/folylpolyglutamate synthase